MDGGAGLTDFPMQCVSASGVSETSSAIVCSGLDTAGRSSLASMQKPFGEARNQCRARGHGGHRSKLTADNRTRYGSNTIRFQCADVSHDLLPSVDMVLCRDCFIHLPTRLILRALKNFQ